MVRDFKESICDKGGEGGHGERTATSRDIDIILSMSGEAHIEQPE